MIPKTIHSVWLSGEDKPAIYRECIQSWVDIMPDYEIKEWTLENLPREAVNIPWVKSACEARKWAYATDYIRLWVLKEYGGVYLDSDVMVYRKFDDFLYHRAFSSVEYNFKVYYNSIKKERNINGLAIEAAVLGAEMNHPWIADILNYYHNKIFINQQKFCWENIMPRIMRDISIEKYGFRLIPTYQVLKENVHLYPPDTFSSSCDLTLTGIQDEGVSLFQKIGKENKVRYAYHVCAHSWYEDTTTQKISWKIKHFILKSLGITTIKRKKQIL